MSLRSVRIVALFGVATCGSPAPPRAQVLLFVNTDVPIPTLADTLRIDSLDPAGTVLTTRILAAPDATNWPVSFGVVPRADGQVTHLRLRLYPGERRFDPA